jgi:L-serine dehydratase
MESLKEMYKIGPGPSSSHTLAPWRAAQLFKQAYPEAISFDVELYGSISLTGKGHFTDQILMSTFAPKLCRVFFRLNWAHNYDHGMIYKAYDGKNRLMGEWTVFSLGGGSIRVLESDFDFQRPIYHYANTSEMLQDVQRNHGSLVQMVLSHESDIESYLNDILEAMFRSVKKGLETTGVLPGLLEVPRVSKSLLLQAKSMEREEQRDRLKLVAYAYANNEENASNGLVVTAPTLGASGVMAALMYHLYYDKGISRQKLIHALMVGGMFGNVVKQNATISGAQGGCQAEIGTACSMAAAALAFVEGFPLQTIEYAAEIAMEHHLGLTCDPVGGYVIIPCIERNGAAVLRAVDAVLMADTIGRVKTPRVNFDTIVRTMNYTGKKIALELRETALGGLATEVDISQKR